MNKIGWFFFGEHNPEVISRAIEQLDCEWVVFYATLPDSIINVMSRPQHQHRKAVVALYWGNPQNPESYFGMRDGGGWYIARAYIVGRTTARDDGQGVTLTNEQYYNADSLPAEWFDPNEGVTVFMTHDQIRGNLAPILAAPEQVRARLYMAEFWEGQGDKVENLDRIRFMEAFALGMKDLGLKACVGNMRTTQESTRFADWKTEGLLSTLRNTGSIIGFHHYFDQRQDMPNYRAELDALGFSDVPLVCTKLGAKIVEVGGINQYINRLRNYLTLPACIYLYGSAVFQGELEAYDVSAYEQMLLPVIKSTTPDPEPEPEPSTVYRIKDIDFEPSHVNGIYQTIKILYGNNVGQQWVEYTVGGSGDEIIQLRQKLLMLQEGIGDIDQIVQSLKTE